jgi:hypothetical protein
MTEDEWVACTNPLPMLDSLAGGTSDRKLRLFACGCLRHIWHLLSDERSRMAVEIAEHYADGTASRDKLINARDGAREAVQQFKWPTGPDSAWRAASAAQSATRDTGMSAARNSFCDASRAPNLRDTNQFDDGEIEHEVTLLRDIFGNPFRPVTFNPSWRTLSVVRLAQTIYDERSFDKVPDLGDALERARCRDEAILNHCRESGEHVRGCWVVDLVLGKK